MNHINLIKNLLATRQFDLKDVDASLEAHVAHSLFFYLDSATRNITTIRISMTIIMRSRVVVSIAIIMAV